MQTQEARMSRARTILGAAVLLLFVEALYASLRVVPAPPTSATNDFYVGNAAPLTRALC